MLSSSEPSYPLGISEKENFSVSAGKALEEVKDWLGLNRSSDTL